MGDETRCDRGNKSTYLGVYTRASDVVAANASGMNSGQTQSYGRLRHLVVGNSGARSMLRGWAGPRSQTSRHCLPLPYPPTRTNLLPCCPAATDSDEPALGQSQPPFVLDAIGDTRSRDSKNNSLGLGLKQPCEIGPTGLNRRFYSSRDTVHRECANPAPLWV